mmetsp:Transcript_53792/g.144016  ORF Transcript_53792/g.144016 Transcript_53792/m.144016 type:complete len:105 (-) Transcript_53792:37-351(-)
MVAVVLGTPCLTPVVGTVVMMGVCTDAAGRTVCAGSFFRWTYLKKGKWNNSRQHTFRQQPIPKAKRNHAHQGHPPPSVVMAVVVVAVAATDMANKRALRISDML